MSRVKFFAFIIILFFLAPLSLAKPLRVLTSINILSQPLSEIFEKQIVNGDLVITSLMAVGSDPHLYVPTRLDLSRILEADLILFVGLNLEAQFDDVLNRVSPQSKVMFVGEALPREQLLSQACDVENKDCLVDPHVWMASSTFKPVLKAGVKAIELELGRTIGAEQKADILVEKVRMNVEQILQKAKITVPLITAHDAFGYYAREFGIETLGIAGISTDIEPSVRRVSKLTTMIVEQDIPAIFLETSVPKRGVQSLLDAAAGQGKSIRVLGPLYTDSLGRKGSSGDTWAGMLISNSLTIACGLGEITLEAC